MQPAFRYSSVAEDIFSFVPPRGPSSAAQTSMALDGYIVAQAPLLRVSAQSPQPYPDYFG